MPPPAPSCWSPAPRAGSAARSRSSWRAHGCDVAVHYRALATPRPRRRSRRAARGSARARSAFAADLADEAGVPRAGAGGGRALRAARRGGQQRLALRVRRRGRASATPRWTAHWRANTAPRRAAGAGAARAPARRAPSDRLRRQPARPEAVEPEPRLLLVHAVEGGAARPRPSLLAQALAPRVRVCGVAPGVTLPSGPMSDERVRSARTG